ncbi:xanthine dehydrogenase FAD-binding subunit XdhB [Olsenella sp. AF16-14LB]|jgi:xanthine dehydrogenase FAD-binding subunit|uniref:Xanthine dehydrogenase FAD-binding subunit XdhB n=1 Tax=Tractidigestivibacter montrealensis TaxID=2972466 RepID=A0ABT1Z628_9ACTN|nr:MULTISPECIES: xanthine dehydrogenase subunit XdhB [Atopobiaceae]MCR9035667.1 xanthine dehydrogenase FAD-binding subunit XdhB [Tractidigestivibacter montrealensis]RGJ46158.1 xanthine dehydrogenase FAD-binding subunit XdhB [Olsenella sp. TM06-36]RGS51997.1 xanthine dehydrogenase FAD-binding subunit XdhB [Olsenella sp. AF21-51]RGU51460.1 xanthine dehydrogenase FAD-binding subunit XdhB [Olsenella sp. AF16-14LB]RGU82475.1 xanthine dehydrogenase FAD-binding subunit XdhB [Olsenella sp. AF15-43LB]
MYDIESLYEATSVEDACRALAEDPQAIVIAGGTDVLVKVRGGKLAGAHLVSIHNLHDELDGVTLADDGTVEIGPITWFHHVTTSPVIQATVPTLGEACDTPGGPQLRVSGTIGGNVCNAATSADSASTLFAYGALLDVVSTRGKRTIPIEEWYAGPGRSYRERDEVLVKIRIPRDHYEGFTGHYFKYGKRRALEIATMGCCCLVKLGADKSTIDDIRLAFGVAAPTPMRATGAEDAVRGLPVAEAVEKIGELAQAETHPRDSWRASKDFRLQLIGEMSRRSLIEAARKGGADI